MNAKLGRAVLDHVAAHREQFDMAVWGYKEPDCGTVACLAGWTLLLSGYTLDEHGDFRNPNGEWTDPPEKAAELLQLTEAERWGEDLEEPTLFTEFNEDVAIARFRALVEAAEAAQ